MLAKALKLLQSLVGPTIWVVILVATAWWLRYSAGGPPERVRLLLAAGASSFVLGCVAGFLFTSYGEEASTVGKIRDWLIGGITGVGLSQLIDQGSAVKRIIGTFMLEPGPHDFALVTSACIACSGLGFFFMYFERELIFNLMLARSRAERGRIEGTQQAGLVAQQVLSALPLSILWGIDDIDDIKRNRGIGAETLRSLLYSDEVNGFLGEAGKVLNAGGQLDWDVVSKVANLQYYRTYFEKDENKYTQAELAYRWVIRGLTMNPLHVDFSVKCADLLGIMKRYDEAVSILERLERTPQAPAYLDQWLGYFLLFLCEREDDSLRYSRKYLDRFPDETDTLFNIACAYAQKYCRSLRKGQSDPRDHRLALDTLKEALEGEPDYAETVRRTYAEKGESFECFASDREFLDIVQDRSQKTEKNPL